MLALYYIETKEKCLSFKFNTYDLNDSYYCQRYNLEGGLRKVNESRKQLFDRLTDIKCVVCS